MKQITPVLVTLLSLVLSSEYALSQNVTKCGEKDKASALLDVARELMNKTKGLIPNCSDDISNCGGKETASALLDIASNLISQVKKNYPTCPDKDCPNMLERPMDCSDIFRSVSNKSGVYTVWPKSRISFKKSLDVFCDMDTDGGGWTVIQRRGNFSTPKDYFYKDWKQYKKGFGNITEEFWLGNDNIYSLSNQINTTIRFDLTDAIGDTAYAQYHTFWIDDEDSKYTLHIRGYSGNAGDAMYRIDNHKFSTKDQDNDKSLCCSCAVDRQGAWWYENCTWSNLNGLNQPGINSVQGIQWTKWRDNVSLGGVEIKLRSLNVK